MDAVGFLAVEYNRSSRFEEQVAGDETRTAYIKRLRKAAMKLPKEAIVAARKSIKKRIQATVQEEGGHIKFD